VIQQSGTGRTLIEKQMTWNFFNGQQHLLILNPFLSQLLYQAFSFAPEQILILF
jgi:hypothetical protein